MVHRIAAAQLGIDFILQPAILATSAGSTTPTLTANGVATLETADGTFTMLASTPLLLRSDALAKTTIIVGSDPRTLFPNRN